MIGLILMFIGAIWLAIIFPPLWLIYLILLGIGLATKDE